MNAGIFVCPKCGKNRVNELEKWQCKKENGLEKWIFFKVHLHQFSGVEYDGVGGGEFWVRKWVGKSKYEVSDFIDERPDKDCWKETGGSTEEEWNKKEEEWKCEDCNFCSKTFKDFIPKKINKKII